jgi:hypothetical protein
MSVHSMRYRVVEGVLARSVGEELVLLHPETERVMTLNGCGAQIWKMLADGMETEPIVARLQEEFSGPGELIRREALEFLSELRAQQLIGCDE